MGAGPDLHIAPKAGRTRRNGRAEPNRAVSGPLDRFPAGLKTADGRAALRCTGGVTRPARTPGRSRMNHKALAGARRPLDHQRTPAREATHEAWTLQAVARAKQGDRSAVRYLYNRHAPTVRHYAASLLRDADLVDDVVQTTFLKL